MLRSKKIRTRVNYKKYTLPLSEKDRLFVRFYLQRGKIVNFTLQYHSLIEKRWRVIRRYDTKHGVAHEHRFYFRNRRKQRKIILGDKADYNAIFTKSQSIVKKNYQKIKQNYFLNK